MTDRAPEESVISGDRSTRLAGYTLGTVAAVTLFAMMLLTFADVWGRYLFNSPVFGGYEVTEFMMGIIIFTALPMLCAQEGHVTIDLLDHILPKASLRWQRVAVNAVSAVVLAVIAWRLLLLSRQLDTNHEVTMTLKIPHAPFALVFGIMAAFATVACLVVTWGYLVNRRALHEGQSV
ncbi:MAG: TRAP transporter small permease [Rhodospirillaceae bacterium]|nr:TRAP transporter small permease [Rhodospirillaceae bacterium]